MTTPNATWVPDADTVYQFDCTVEATIANLKDSSKNQTTANGFGTPTIISGFQGNARHFPDGFHGYNQGGATPGGTIFVDERLVRFTVAPAGNAYISHAQNNTGTIYGYGFYVSSDGKLHGFITDALGVTYQVDSSSAVFPQAGFWHVRFTADIGNNLLKLEAGAPGAALAQVGTFTIPAGRSFSPSGFATMYAMESGDKTTEQCHARFSLVARADYFPVPGSAAGYRLSSVVPQSSTVVRATFDTALNHVSAGNVNDALNPANYVFSGGLTAASVAHVSGGTVFDITLASETAALSYTLQVINARSASSDLAIDAQGSHDKATFAGIATPPTCLSVSPGDGFVDVTFSKAMDPSAVLAAAFSVTGGSPYLVTVKSVLKLSATQWRVYTSRQHAGDSYALALAGTLRDTFGNALAPASVSFTGSASPLAWTASIVPDPLGQLATQIRVVFNQDVDPTSAGNALNYQLDKGGSVKSAAVTSSRVVLLTTSPLQPNVPYQLTVS